MGSYTTNFKFYKPDPSENVNVDSQLNANLDITDFHTKGLLEYETYARQNFGIDSDIIGSRQTGHRFYKTYSNSLWVNTGPSANGVQDLNAFVTDWHDASSTISTSSGTWTQYTSQPACYRKIAAPGSSTTEVEWTGRLWLGGTALTNQFSYNPVMDLTTAFAPITPAITKYFDVYGGNTSSGYSIIRVIIANSGQVGFYKYGQGVATGTGENYVDLGGVRYTLEA